MGKVLHTNPLIDNLNSLIDRNQSPLVRRMQAVQVLENHGFIPSLYKAFITDSPNDPTIWVDPHCWCWLAVFISEKGNIIEYKGVIIDKVQNTVYHVPVEEIRAETLKLHEMGII